MKRGDTIGQYRIVRLIGRGGMGEVYEVEHLHLGVRYALKTFVLENASAGFLRERFMAEGRTLARISHPNIARVIDLGVLPDGTAFFVMDLVLDASGEPRTLADVSPDGFSSADCLRWLKSIASAIDEIHSQGIVHRDIKASNILIDAENDAILVDFGISRYVHGRIKREIGVEQTVVAGDDESSRRIFMGTSGYLAPELQNGGEASAASDVYALGVAFFRLLTGLWPEPGTDALRLLEPLDGPWLGILSPMLERNPAKRPARLADFLNGTIAAANHRANVRKYVRAGIAATIVIAITIPFALLHSDFHSQTLGRQSPSFGSRLLAFDLGAGQRIEMVECRDADGKRFWIGASHVTNAEWLRVTGNNRKGMDDEPAIGLSMHEIDAFIAELNRRFASQLPNGLLFRLPTTNELAVASTAGGANAADASVLGALGPSTADKKLLARENGTAWEGVMTKLPCRVRTKPPNAWGIYDIVGQGKTICLETDGVDEKNRPRHVQLGPDDIAALSTCGEWGWNSTVRLAIGEVGK